MNVALIRYELEVVYLQKGKELLLQGILLDCAPRQACGPLARRFLPGDCLEVSNLRSEGRAGSLASAA